MSLPIVLMPEAEAEFEDMADYYEKQAGLARLSLRMFRQVLDRISGMPLIHQIACQDIRRGVVRRFPYTVFYRVENNRIVAHPIFHQLAATCSFGTIGLDWGRYRASISSSRSFYPPAIR